jgi:phosphomannomutase
VRGTGLAASPLDDGPVAGVARRDPELIRFGTSGWRGVLGEVVTFPRLRTLARATAGWLREQGESRRVLVGYDTRFASRAMAEETARVLAEEGFRPKLTSGPVPTPVLTHAIRRRRVAGGLMLTASHNPPEYHGLKVFGPDGGAIPDRAARAIESRLGRASSPGLGPATGVRRGDLAESYVRDLGRLLDRERLAAARLHVVYDAMHGAGAGVLDRLLEDLGCRVTVLRGEPDPRFGGAAPDPVPARLGPLAARMVGRRGRALGLATDGDADRLAVVLPGGGMLHETEVLALLVDHLARTGRIRVGVAISWATGSLVERVAEDHGLRVERHPIGFKHLADELRQGTVDVAGEESGGFAWSRMGIDKDGMLGGALLCELAAGEPGGVARRLTGLRARFGRPACGRRALATTDALERGLVVLAAGPPSRVGDAPVRHVANHDGLHLRLDDGFVMWRRSGTEPVVRIYAEAPGRRRLERRLAAGERLLAAAGRSRASG